MEKVAHIPHGIDTARFHPPSAGERAGARARFGLPADACVIAYTGRLLRGKGLEDLIAAFAQVAADVPSAHLLIVGSGAGQALSVEDDLRATVVREGLGARVTFTGALDDVSEALRAADVFAFPSVFEALGLSLIEAAATGLPAVGARTGGIVDVIEDGASGWLVAPGDVAALAARLRALARDAAARARLGARGAGDRGGALRREEGPRPVPRPPRRGRRPRRLRSARGAIVRGHVLLVEVQRLLDDGRLELRREVQGEQHRDEHDPDQLRDQVPADALDRGHRLLEVLFDAHRPFHARHLLDVRETYDARRLVDLA